MHREMEFDQHTWKKLFLETLPKYIKLRHDLFDKNEDIAWKNIFENYKSCLVLLLCGFEWTPQLLNESIRINETMEKHEWINFVISTVPEYIINSVSNEKTLDKPNRKVLQEYCINYEISLNYFLKHINHNQNQEIFENISLSDEQWFQFVTEKLPKYYESITPRIKKKRSLKRPNSKVIKNASGENIKKIRSLRRLWRDQKPHRKPNKPLSQPNLLRCRSTNSHIKERISDSILPFENESKKQYNHSKLKKYDKQKEYKSSDYYCSSNETGISNKCGFNCGGSACGSEDTPSDESQEWISLKEKIHPNDLEKNIVSTYAPLGIYTRIQRYVYIINLVIPTVIKNFENLPIANSQPDLKKRRRLAREFDLRWRRNLYAFSNEFKDLQAKLDSLSLTTVNEQMNTVSTIMCHLCNLFKCISNFFSSYAIYLPMSIVEKSPNILKEILYRTKFLLSLYCVFCGALIEEIEQKSMCKFYNLNKLIYLIDTKDFAKETRLLLKKTTSTTNKKQNHEKNFQRRKLIYSTMIRPLFRKLKFKMRHRERVEEKSAEVNIQMEISQLAIKENQIPLPKTPILYEDTLETQIGIISVSDSTDPESEDLKIEYNSFYRLPKEDSFSDNVYEQESLTSLNKSNNRY